MTATDKALERAAGLRAQQSQVVDAVALVREGRNKLEQRAVRALNPATAEKRRAAAEAARGMLGRDPTRSATDELIAERRVDAEAEMATSDDEETHRSQGPSR